VRVTVQSMTCSHRFRLCHTHSIPILYMAMALWRSAMSLRTFFSIYELCGTTATHVATRFILADGFRCGQRSLQTALAWVQH
jgi:hypothetical protein